jgi:hypothetical protein
MKAKVPFWLRPSVSMPRAGFRSQRNLGKSGQQDRPGSPCCSDHLTPGNSAHGNVPVTGVQESLPQWSVCIHGLVLSQSAMMRFSRGSFRAHRNCTDSGSAEPGRNERRYGRTLFSIRHGRARPWTVPRVRDPESGSPKSPARRTLHHLPREPASCHLGGSQTFSYRAQASGGVRSSVSCRAWRVRERTRSHGSPGTIRGEEILALPGRTRGDPRFPRDDTKKEEPERLLLLHERRRTLTCRFCFRACLCRSRSSTARPRCSLRPRESTRARRGPGATRPGCSSRRMRRPRSHSMRCRKCH